jgi:hypothetical protein
MAHNRPQTLIRPDVSVGSKAPVWRCPRYFRFAPGKPTFLVRFGMSVWCHKRKCAVVYISEATHYFRSNTFLDFRLLLKQGERTKHEEHDLVRRARRTQYSHSICARPTSASSLVSIAETLRPPVQRYSPTAKLRCADINHARASRGEVRTLNERLTFLHNR